MSGFFLLDNHLRTLYSDGAFNRQRQEGPYACFARPDPGSLGGLCASVHSPGLESRPSTDVGSHCRPRKAHRSLGPARHGSSAGTALHQLPPGSQPGGVACLVCRQGPARAVGSPLATRSATADTCGRDHRTAHGNKINTKRGFSRRRALLAQQGCPLLRSALGRDDVARCRSLV
jgi:hypothetical protein